MKRSAYIEALLCAYNVFLPKRKSAYIEALLYRSPVLFVPMNWSAYV